MTMSNRERVLAALEHREPDRVPFDLGGTFASTMVLGAYQKLTAYLGVDDPQPKIWRKSSQVILPHDEVLRKLEIDTRPLLMGGPDVRPEMENAKGDLQDEWGIIRSKPPSSFYYDLTGSPLKGEITLDQIENYSWPDPDDPGRYRGLEERSRQIYETGYATILCLPLGFLHQTQFLRGFEDWFADLILNPELSGIMMDKVNEVNMKIVCNALEICEQYVDVVMYGDDLAAQNGPMYSNDIYRQMIKPRQKRMFNLIKSKSRAKILYHSCGSIIHLIDDLAEIGVDAINPVQVSARDMDTRELKAKCGRKMAFWGGVDTQKVLPRGTREEVRLETKKRLEDLMPGGGYVLNSVHNIQPDVPPENVVAMFEAGKEFGWY